MFRRPNSTVGLYKRAAMLRCGIDEIETVTMTSPATGAALPQSAASAVQQYSSYDATPVAVVCSGTIVKTGDTYGILFEDAALSTAATYITKARKVLMQIVAADAAGITVGVDLFIVDATMRITHDANGGANNYIGKCVASSETDPVDLPAGIYAVVNFNQAKI